MKSYSCEDRIDENLRERLADLCRLFSEGFCDDLGTLEGYALGFDYVSPLAFDGQAEGYFRYQISWGGPSDEFRFFTGSEGKASHVEYWFLDWFDGAHRVCGQRPEVRQLWRWLSETGAVRAAWRNAQH